MVSRQQALCPVPTTSILGESTRELSTAFRPRYSVGSCNACLSRSHLKDFYESKGSLMAHCKHAGMDREKPLPKAGSLWDNVLIQPASQTPRDPEGCLPSKLLQDSHLLLHVSLCLLSHGIISQMNCALGSLFLLVSGDQHKLGVDNTV